jgi:hypothetical protein
VYVGQGLAVLADYSVVEVWACNSQHTKNSLAMSLKGSAGYGSRLLWVQELCRVDTQSVAMPLQLHAMRFGRYPGHVLTEALVVVVQSIFFTCTQLCMAGQAEPASLG